MATPIPLISYPSLPPDTSHHCHRYCPKPLLMHTHLGLDLTCIVSITSNPSRCAWTWTHQGHINMAELGPVEAPVIPHGHASISTSAKPKTVAPLAAPVPLTSYPSLLPETSLSLDLTCIIGSTSNASQCAQTWAYQGHFGTAEPSPIEAPVTYGHAPILTSVKPTTHLHCTHASLALHVSQLPCASLPLLAHPLAPHPPLAHPMLTPLAPLSPLCSPLTHL